MAKVIIAGNAVVINSSMKLDDLKMIAKYRPDALTLMGGEKKDEPVFSIFVADGNGSINSVGAVFGEETRDDAKLATMTMVVKPNGDVKEYVADELGSALINLSKLEETLPSVIEEIKAERASILDSIEIAQ